MVGLGKRMLDGRVVVGCGEDKCEREERRPGPRWDVMQVAWIGSEAAEGVETGRYRQDCPSPNEVAFAWARPGQPSLHMPAERPLRPCGYV